MSTTTIFKYITDTFSPTVILLACAVLYICLLVFAYLKGFNLLGAFSRKRFRTFPKMIKAILIIVKATFTSVALVIVLKWLLKIPRPTDMLVIEIGYGFPSAHAAVSFAFFTAIAYCLSVFRGWKNAYLLLIIPALVSISRLVLHVHRPIDVIVGAVVGILSAIAIIRMYVWYVR